jgi:glycosyltransferase involved in cell wall biosynthesis
MDAITICAANYLPFASVLGNSFLETNPKSTFSILVIDSKKVTFEKNSKFRYLGPEDLEINPDVFANMAFYYNVTELATALKPSALKALFRQGSSKVIYLDPDIQVFSELVELEVSLETNPIVLTPHTLTPIPRDGLRPTEADIMGSGTFNLGFLGLSDSPVAMDLLNWWEERLRFDSISDPLEMLFTDQRWIDLVPSYFPICVLRHPGYNVAYWNLHERSLTENQSEIQVNNDQLRFFHFSGYRPDKPWILSKYVSDVPRIVISKDPVLALLCEKYGSAAIEVGWEHETAIEYGYQNFENGKFIPSSLRRLYRQDCITAFKIGEILRPPENWQDWATERSLESGNLSRILFSIWKSRPDLKRRYPDATGAEAGDLVAWASTHGIQEKVIDQSLLKIGSLKDDVIPSKFNKSPGINIAGYLNGELGLGQSARLIYQAAKESGFPVTTINSNRVTSRKDEFFEEVSSDYFYPVTIAVVNADHFHLWVEDFGTKKIEKTFVIGVWAWEIEDFPEHMHRAFSYVDEIWVVSEFVKNAIAKHTNKPIFVLPTPIITPQNIESLNRNSLGIHQDARYNLFIFDYLSVFNRKNPLGLVEAHMEAFPEQDGPLLVIKSMNGDRDAENREKLRFSIRNRGDIILIEKFLSRPQLTALINECETYVSLHRSEGYGLTIAEAMALGKPVVATSYSGNLDFMDKNNSFLIPFKLKKIGFGSYPYSPDSYWAEPDVHASSKVLKDLYIDGTLRQEFGRAAKGFVTNKFGLVVATSFIENRVRTNLKLLKRMKKKINKIALLQNKVKKFIRNALISS